MLYIILFIYILLYYYIAFLHKLIRKKQILVPKLEAGCFL